MSANASEFEPRTDELDTLSDALGALVDGSLKEIVKKRDFADFVIRELREETGFPRIACRALYWWAVVPAVGRLQMAVGARIDASMTLGRRFALSLVRRIGRDTLLERFRSILERSASDGALDAKPVVVDAAGDRTELIEWLQAQDEKRGRLFDELVRQLERLSESDPPIFVQSDVDPRSTRERRELLPHLTPYDLLEREKEKRALEQFLSGDGAFRWWFVRGPGGVGKSRLCYDLVQGLGDGWQTGFLASDSDFEWTAWAPTAPTLIIIDHAADRPKDARRVLVAALRLQKRQEGLGFPVRVLLVDRSFPRTLEEARSNPIWQQVFGDETVYDSLAARLHAEPLSLRPLALESAYHLIEEVSERSADALPARLREQLQDDETDLRRPLFLLLIGQALRNRDSTDDFEWDMQGIIDIALSSSGRCPWLNQDADEAGRVASQVIVWATMTGQSDRDLITGQLTAGGVIPETAQLAAAYALASNAVGLEAASDDRIAAMQPKILGEFFCLKYLGHLRRDQPAVAARLVDLIFRIDDADDEAQWEKFYHLRGFWSDLVRDVWKGYANGRGAPAKRAASDDLVWIAETADPIRDQTFVGRYFRHQTLEGLVQSNHPDLLARVCQRFGVPPDAGEFRPTLFLAAEAGSEAIVEWLLNAGADPNTRDADGEPALSAAARNGRVAIAKLLIEAPSIELDAEGIAGSAALHQAAQEGQVEIAQLLLEAGADVNAETESGATALILAAENGQAGVVTLLLEREGADLERTGAGNATALYMAVQQDHAVIVRLLLAAGADPNAEAENGARPLIIAAETGNQEIVKSLLADRRIEIDGGGGGAGVALHQAVQEGHLEVVKRLIEHGAAINKKKESGATPLLVAAFRGRQAMVEILLAQPAIDLEARLQTGATALHVAASQGHVTVARLLLEAGANVNLGDENQTTPLMVAAASNHGVEAVQLLLAQPSVLVDARDVDGWTALHFAAAAGDLAIINRLLEAGANPDARADNGASPLLIAVEKGQEKAALRFLETGRVDANAAGTGGGAALHHAVYGGPLALVRALLAAGADPEARTQVNGVTPLFLACEAGQSEIIVELLDRAGADVNARGTDETTPLHVACMRQAPDDVRLLLDRGAEVNARKASGATPLVIAAEAGQSEIVALLLETPDLDIEAAGAGGGRALHQACQEGYLEVAKALVEAGVDVNARTQRDATPLIQAAKNGHAMVVSLLLGRPETVVDAGSTEGATALHMAAQEGFVRIVVDLLDAGADVNARSETGATPLVVAAENGRTDVMMALLDRSGIDVEAAGAGAGRALHQAAQGGHFEVVRALIAAGAEVNAQKQAGVTPLHMAALNGHVAVVQELLRGPEIDANVADELGLTALHLASVGGHLGSVLALVAAQTDVNASANDGATPLMMAAGNGHTAVSAVLLAQRDIAVEAGAGADGTALHLATAAGHAEAVSALLAAGADPNATMRTGATPLVLASEHGAEEVVQILLRRSGVELDATGVGGLTALHQAALRGHSDIAEALIQAGASLDVLDEQGGTPLSLAFMGGNPKLAEHLIDRGANGRIKNRDGISPLTICRWSELAALERKILGEEDLGLMPQVAE